MDPISTQLLAASQKEQEYDGCIAVAHVSSPYITVYPFTRSGGFGTKYSNPSTLPAAAPITGPTTTFTNDGTVLAFPSNTSSSPGNLNFYNWSKTTGFGTKITQTTGPTSAGIYRNCTTKPSEYGSGWHYILFATQGAIWRYHVASGSNITEVNSKNTGFGSVESTLQFNNAGTYVLVNSGVYPWTDGWIASTVNLGTRISFTGAPITLAYGDWHPSDTVIVYADGASPGTMSAYNFGGGLGSLINNAPNPTASVRNIRFSASGKTVFASSLDSPYITAHAFDQTTGFGSKFSNPSTLPPTYCYCVERSKTNDLVAVVSGSSPYIVVYPWNDTTGFGVKYSNPSSLPAGQGYSVAFM